jgi:hypothetical protein
MPQNIINRKIRGGKAASNKSSYCCAFVVPGRESGVPSSRRVTAAHKKGFSITEYEIGLLASYGLSHDKVLREAQK